jgi:hypothetical protein
MEEELPVADHPPEQLPREFVKAGCPRNILRGVLLPGRKREASPSEIRKVLAAFEPHLPPPAHWCLEVVANLDAANDRQLLLLADYDLRRVGNPYEVRGLGRRDETIPAWQVERLRTGVQVVWNVASQLGAGSDAVTLRVDEAEHLRRLARIHGRRRHGHEIPLFEVHRSRREVLGMVVLGGELDEAQTVRGSWVDAIDEPYEPQFEGNWIVTSAAAFLVDVGRRADGRHVKRCDLPLGRMAYLDHLLGTRAGPALTCSTVYVAERSDARCCERERCKQMQKLVNNPDALQEALDKRRDYHAESGGRKRRPRRSLSPCIPFASPTRSPRRRACRSGSAPCYQAISYHAVASQAGNRYGPSLCGNSRGAA